MWILTRFPYSSTSIPGTNVCQLDSSRSMLTKPKHCLHCVEQEELFLLYSILHSQREAIFKKVVTSLLLVTSPLHYAFNPSGNYLLHVFLFTYSIKLYSNIRMKYWNITLYVVDNTHVDPKVQNVSCSALCDCGSLPPEM